MQLRPLVLTGAALVSTGALVAATPTAFVPDSEVRIAAPVPGPQTKVMTVDSLRLMAIENITLAAISDAFFNGYGGFVTGPVANPNTGFNNCDDGTCQAGFAGVPYLFVNELLPEDIELDNYFFETGFDGAAKHLLTEAGIPSDLVEAVFDPIDLILLPAIEEITAAIGLGGLGEAFADTGFEGVVQTIVNTIIGNEPDIFNDEEMVATQLSDEDEESKDLGPGNTDLGKKFVNLSVDGSELEEQTIETDVDDLTGTTPELPKAPEKKAEFNPLKGFQDTLTGINNAFQGALPKPEVKVEEKKEAEEEVDEIDDLGANKAVPGVLTEDKKSKKSGSWNPVAGLEKKLGFGRGAREAAAEKKAGGGPADGADAGAGAGGGEGGGEGGEK